MKRSEAIFVLSKLISPFYRDKKELYNVLDRASEDWEGIIFLANRYLLIPALYKSLKDKGLFDRLEDEMLKGYLEEIYLLNGKRNQAIISQLKELCDIFSCIDITPVLLKGSASLSEDSFGDLSVRSMADIDMLVPYERILEAIEELRKYGYKEIDPSSKLGIHWHHYRRMYRADLATSVEVHRSVISYGALEYMGVFDLKLHTMQSKMFKNAKVLDPTFEFYYTFLHSEIAHKYHDLIISLRHLHHGAMLIYRYKDEIDFEKIESFIKKYSLEKVWREYLWIQKRLFDIDIPFKIADESLYEKRVCANIDDEGSYGWYVKMFFMKVKNAFSFKNLQKNFPKLRYRYQLFYYMPIRFFYLSYKIATDKKKRKMIVKSIKTTV